MISNFKYLNNTLIGGNEFLLQFINHTDFLSNIKNHQFFSKIKNSNTKIKNLWNTPNDIKL